MLKATYLNGFNSIPTRTIVTSNLGLFVDAGNPNSYGGSGTTWTDISGNGRNLTLNNSPTHTSTGGGYFTFNGTTQFVTGTNNGLGTGQINFTLEMWVYFTTITGTRWWLCNIAQASDGGFHCIGSSPTNTQFGVWNITPQAAPNLLGADQWLHVTTVYNNAVITVYVNGALSSEVSLNPGNVINTTDTNINIGQAQLGGEAYFAGRISKVRTYSAALSQTQIQYNFEAERYQFPI